MNTKKRNNNNNTLELKSLSLAVMMSLGLFGTHTVDAGPGLVCAGGVLPTGNTCPNAGRLIPTYYANSPTLRKFVDTLPGFTPAGANKFADGKTAGAYIPVAVSDTASYPGSSYYELAIVEYSQKMHSDLPKATTLRGYVQIDRKTTNNQMPNSTSKSSLALKYPDGTQIFIPREKGLVNGVWDHSLDLDNFGNPVMVPAIGLEKPLYFGPLIVATKGVATRVKFSNLLPKGRATIENGQVNRHGDLFLPVDESLPGAGNSTIPLATYPQNRSSIHLHGGDSPWISDGTPHQWFTPETSNLIDPSLKHGSRFNNVPDMPYPGDIAQTVYWPNDQSERFMWYHDHTFGLTRQNAYIGEAAPYFIIDPTEEALLATALPTDVLPIVVQDKTFVASDIQTQDSKWDQAHWGTPGDLWYPHVYEPNLIDTDLLTKTPINPPEINDAGRWDYGPTASTTPFTSVLPLPSGEYGHVSVGPEAYMDTPLVNGVAYPTVTLQPKAYRARFLNGSNDRYFNLSLWQADPTVTSSDGRTNTEIKLVPELIPSTITIVNGGKKYKAPQVVITDLNGYGSGATATAQISPTGVITGITITNPGSSYSNPQVKITDATGSGAAVTLQTIPGRDGGIPDPATAGPSVIRFSTEGGLLPAPVIFKPQTMSYAGTTETAGDWYIAPAERGEAVIDFSKYAGKTLILYNDSSAPVPDGDSRYDYYTGNADLRGVGGSNTTLAGFGPNTRTVMQIKIANTTPAATYDPKGTGGALATVLPKVYAAKADPHIENNIVADGKMTTQTLTQWLAAHKNLNVKTKTIEGGFDVNFGRLIANFGLELPLLNGATPMAYIDKPTDIVEDGKVQYWLIKNNDADNHPIHIHLFSVQVIARVDHLTGQIINPLPYEAGWKENVQNWPFQDTIVALKPKTPVLPFGLPDSVRLMDPTMNPGDATNTSLNPNYVANNVPPNAVPLAFQQYDLTTGALIPPVSGTVPGVVNDIQNFGWEYVYHCHILGHEENDLMRPMIFLPKKVTLPAAPTNVTLNATTGKLTWTDATPINGSDKNGVLTNGNPANEIGFRVEYAVKTNNVVGSYKDASNKVGQSNFIVIPDNILLNNLNPNPKPKINSLANSGAFTVNLTALPAKTQYVFRVVAVNQAGESNSSTVAYTKP